MIKVKEMINSTTLYSAILNGHLFLLGCLLSNFALAAIPVWHIDPNKSALSFTAIQQGAPVSGKFKTFTGDITFDPEQLNASKIRIVVAMDSVSTDYEDLEETLRNVDWFDVKLFPQATFIADHFIQVAPKTYQADGVLTIRDKSEPTKVTFVLEDFSKTNALVKGQATLKRTQFGVGQGEWAATDDVADDVQVDFTLAATVNEAVIAGQDKV